MEVDKLWDDAWFRAGLCLFSLNKYYESIHYFKKAIQINGVNENYWLAVADAELAMGNTLSSLDAYEEAGNLAPDNPSVWLKWSAAMYESGYVDKAAEIVMDALDECPENAELHYRAVAYLISSGKYKQAFNLLENALILDFDKHIMLFDFFSDLETQKALYQIIDQYKTL